MNRRGEDTVFTVWKRGEYVGEGTADEMVALTGLARQTIHIIASPSYKKAGKKWLAERVVCEDDVFASFDNVNYKRIREEIKRLGMRVSDVAECIGNGYENTSNKLNKRTRFRYTEIEALEDVFFLNEGELLND